MEVFDLQLSFRNFYFRLHLKHGNQIEKVEPSLQSDTTDEAASFSYLLPITICSVFVRCYRRMIVVSSEVVELFSFK